MENLGELRLDARLETVRLALYFVNGVGQHIGLDDKALFEVELAVEEALVNIINHAYPRHVAGEMVIRLSLPQENVFQMTLLDWGIPLDPDDVTDYDMNAPIESRIQGGMGLHFINSLTDSVVRSTTPNLGSENSLTLIKHFNKVAHPEGGSNTARELNAILSVSQVMTTGLDLDDLLSQIVNQLVETVEAERGTLYLVDQENDEIFSRILMDDSGRVSEIRVGIGKGIAGQVAETGQLLNIPNAYEHEGFHPDVDKVTGFRTKSILAVPMRNRYQEVIGVVQLLNKRGGVFTHRDERLLTAMAAQAAISIENARLYDQEMRQQLINQDLATARNIQTSFLPDHIPQHPQWSFARYWSPMREVGGDFYDFYGLPDGRLAILVADVSGKGVPAAMFMALCVTVLRFAMSLSFGPNELLDHANQLIISDQSSKMFATVFVTYVNLNRGDAHFASAGHNPPLLYRHASQTCSYLEASGVAMGLFLRGEYDDRAIQLDKGDILVLYTDGITEAVDADEEEFGEGRLEALIQTNADRPAQELCDLILEAVDDFARETGQFDDKTLIVIKYNLD